jgi:beta-N-acetylhexosaminidase
MRPVSLVLCIVFATTSWWSCRRTAGESALWPTPFLNQAPEAIQGAIGRMTIEEKIGQLLLLSASPRDSSQARDVVVWAQRGQLGGIHLRGLSLSHFKHLVDTLQELSAVPLYVATEERVLLHNQFADLLSMPGPETVRAVAADSLRQRLRSYYFDQAEAVGINLVLNLPMATPRGLPTRDDLGDGQTREHLAMIDALNKQGVLSVGRGLSLPPPNSDTATLNAHQVRYRTFVEAGISGFFLDSAFLARTLPDPVPRGFVRQFLGRRYGFGGLILAEPNAAHSPLALLRAGVDMLIVRDDPETIHTDLLAAARDNRLSAGEIDEKTRKVLLAKYWMRAPRREAPTSATPMRLGGALPLAFADTPNSETIASVASADPLLAHFTSAAWARLRRRLYEASLTLAGNPHRLIPLGDIAARRYEVYAYSDKPFRSFEEQFAKFADAQVTRMPRNEEGGTPPLPLELGTGRLGIVLFDEYGMDVSRDSAFIDMTRRLGAEGKLIMINFSNPVHLAHFDSTLTVVQLYERSEYSEALAAQLLFGAAEAAGRLPFTISEDFREGQGESNPLIRLKYANPEEVGIAPERLVGIDAIVRTAIADGAMPGAQVLLAKNGKIFYNKTFGAHTYEVDAPPVRATDLYDVASITKVAGATLAAMKLYEEKAWRLNDRLRDHLSLDNRSTIRNIQLRKLLIHESGLQAHMPVLPYLLFRDVPNAQCDRYFCKESRAPYTVQVADSFYFLEKAIDTIWRNVERLPVGNQRRYRYSDVNMFILQRLIEEKTNAPLDQWLETNYYRPLGLRRTGFNPSRRFPLHEITPTQNDLRWRQQLVHGFVHDESAALLGGVAGHAGLFSAAEELAVIFQMLVNGGAYGGDTFLQPETIQLFTSSRHGNHRGLGFDKPYKTNENAMAPSASPNTYGHNGFTGCSVWVDPEKELIFVFLSNRIHPFTRNGLLMTRNVRRRTHQVAYDALDTYVDEIPPLASR